MTRPSLPQNYFKTAPSLIDNFSDISKWTATGNSTIAEDSRTETGAKSVKLTTTSAVGGFGTMDMDINRTITNGRAYLNVYCVTNPSTTMQSIFLYLGSVPWSKYFNLQVTSGKLRQGWNRIPFTPDNISGYTGGETWASTFTKMRVAVQPVNGQTAEVVFDSVYFEGESGGKGKIIFTFDDGWETAYLNAFQYMTQKGIKATMYTIPNFLNDVNGHYMTTAQLQQIFADGHCIANHTINHAYYTSDSYTIANYTQKVKECRDWLIANGYGDGAYHIAYPRGEYDAAVIESLKTLGMKTGRAVKESYTFPFAIPDKFQLHIRPFDSGVTLATAKGWVDTAIATGVTTIFMLHQIPVTIDNSVTAQNTLSWSKANFEQLVDYVVERKADCETIVDWYRGLEDPRKQVNR